MNFNRMNWCGEQHGFIKQQIRHLTGSMSWRTYTRSKVLKMKAACMNLGGTPRTQASMYLFPR